MTKTRTNVQVAAEPKLSLENKAVAPEIAAPIEKPKLVIGDAETLNAYILTVEERFKQFDAGFKKIGEFFEKVENSQKAQAAAQIQAQTQLAPVQPQENAQGNMLNTIMQLAPSILGEINKPAGGTFQDRMMEMLFNSFQRNQAISETFMNTVIGKIAGTAAQEITKTVIPTA